MAIEVPSSIAHDIRQPVTGDSFNWEGIEPAAAKKSIVIHATASQAPDEDGFVVADYHVNHNGWGGVGVHLVCTKDEYPGRPQFGLPAGAQLHYVGDLESWRAGTINQNPGRIHIEISGLFTEGNGIPSANQLRAVRAFIDWAISPNQVLPSLNFYNQVTYHNAVPGQNTACPGWAHPSFQAWFAYLQGGLFPEHLYTPLAPVSPPPPEAPAVVTPETPQTPGKGAVNIQVDPIVGFEPAPDTLTVMQDWAVAFNTQTGNNLETSRPALVLGTKILISGYFNFNGERYARTEWATANLKPIGILARYFDVPTGQLTGPVAVNVTDISHPAPEPIVIQDPTAVQTGVTDSELQAATVPDTSKMTVLQLLKELVAQIVAKFIRKKL